MNLTDSEVHEMLTTLWHEHRDIGDFCDKEAAFKWMSIGAVAAFKACENLVAESIQKDFVKPVETAK